MGFLDYHVAEDVYLALAKLQGGLAQGSVTGTTRFVDNSNFEAVDAKGKGSFYAPFATIDYAIGQCEANKGDVVLAMPGHDETISGATGIDLDVASTSILGLGCGTYRPKVTLDNTAATIAIDAHGCRIENLRIENAVSALVNCVEITTNGHSSRLAHCDFSLATPSTDEINDAVLIGATSDLVIAHNRFNFGGVGSPYCDTCIKTTNATHRLSVLCNYIAGNFTGASAVSIGGASNDVLVLRNMIYNAANVAGGAIDFANSVIGIIAGNRGYCANPAAIDPGDSGCCSENYFTDDLSKSGTLDPAA